MPFVKEFAHPANSTATQLSANPLSNNEPASGLVVVIVINPYCQGMFARGLYVQVSGRKRTGANRISRWPAQPASNRRHRASIPTF
jgi:hypothetical protein